MAHEPEGNIGPDRLTKVPGVVGELVDWNVSSARWPQKLALGAASTTAGTLIGRRVAGPTNSATDLYCVALAGTAAGKQHAIDCIKNALCAAGAMDTIGPGDFASSRAVVNFVTRVTLSLCAMDEFGSFLHRINSKNAGHYERDITGELRKLWGISWSRYDSSETANTKSETVHSPALSIYGTATPQDFYTAVKSPDIGNGFLKSLLDPGNRAARAGAVPARERSQNQTLLGTKPEKVVSAHSAQHPHPQHHHRDWAVGAGPGPTVGSGG